MSAAAAAAAAAKVRRDRKAAAYAPGSDGYNDGTETVGSSCTVVATIQPEGGDEEEPSYTHTDNAPDDKKGHHGHCDGNGNPSDTIDINLIEDIYEKRAALQAQLKELLDKSSPIRNMPEPSDPMAGMLLS